MKNTQTSFFTVVGNRDPLDEPGGVQGPALDLLTELMASGPGIAEVLVAWTPGAKSEKWPGGFDARKDALVGVVRERWPAVRVQEVPLNVRPNAAAELLPVLARALERFRFAGRVHVNTSSGTPQMLEALKVLRGTGWFGSGEVTLWEVDGLAHRQAGRPFARVLSTPFLEEALKLDGAFSAMRRFDFAGAQDGFNALPDSEVPGRHRRIQVLAQVAEALYLLDARDFMAADEVLRELTLPVPAVDGLERALRQSGMGRDGVLWLTWARFDRAVRQERVADALIWAVILREAMLTALLARRGISEEAKEVRRSADGVLWDELLNLSPALKAKAAGRSVLNIKDISTRLELLRTGLFGGRVAGRAVEFVDVLDDRKHELMEVTAERRNRVIHQGAVPEHEWLGDANQAVAHLMAQYPFENELHCAWQRDPQAAPFSAQSLLRLADDLQEWVG